MPSPPTSDAPSRKSSKRSAAKPRRLPDRLRLEFYVDECLGRRVAAALTAAGYITYAGVDHFPGEEDHVFLPIVGENRWVFLTKDKHVRRNQLEVDAILNSGLRAFVLTAAGLGGDEQAAVFVRAMRKIVRICRQRGPFVYNLTRTGLITQVSNRRLRRRARGRR